MKYLVVVSRVIDGDTIDVEIDLGFDICIKKRIRLLGMDAPEIHSLDADEKKHGLESKRWLEKALESGQISVEVYPESGVDKYGRTLAKVFNEELCINDIMIENGLAYKYDGKAKHKNSARQDAEYKK